MNKKKIIGLKGSITAMTSMGGIWIIALLHNYKVINLSPFIFLPLSLFSFLVTLFGILHMYGEVAKRGDEK